VVGMDPHKSHGTPCVFILTWDTLQTCSKITSLQNLFKTKQPIFSLENSVCTTDNEIKPPTWSFWFILKVGSTVRIPRGCVSTALLKCLFVGDAVFSSSFLSLCLFSDS
jgi:hypothetical protein